MKTYSLTHLSDEVLRRELTNKAAREKEATADLLAHIAEFDEWKLYRPAAYESMFAYCVGELRLSEDAAAKRIHAARAARRCPAVFAALADGRVHLSAIVLLAPHLTPETADQLLTAATHQSKAGFERLLAERFPMLDVPGMVPAQPQVIAKSVSEHAPGHVDEHVSGEEVAAPASRVKPLAPESYAVQFTLDQTGHDLLRQAQELLGHQVARGDIAAVFRRALKLYVAHRERRKFAATDRPRRAQKVKSGSRHIPAHVKRGVWERDGGRCTFVSESGRRCESRSGIEFDHVLEFARGGEATAEGIRLRCRAHNQYTAERTYGAGFMRDKREAAIASRARRAGLQPYQLEVIPWLRQLGCGVADSRLAAERCADMAGAPLEERVKRALSLFGERCSRTAKPAVCA